MKKKYIIGGLIIIVFITWAAISFQDTLTPYVSINEAKAMEKRVQIAGIRMDSGQFDLQSNMLRFRIKDDKGDVLMVYYDGPKPGNFDQATQVVCKGIYKNGVFHADEILVKCPSKYQQEGVKV
ncbi:MAG: cytochrome c maturation protein CcmE [Calditrichaceae bacterium]|nr:cytochrome c maturation protein CcmE [Calditrichaceae bacterium]MBN2709390.1 cytochrome c maturation protein CcmE [Calditrichaceae bacterium]RQV95763.1 MAG: cytochrome c maturation protein CcmE [Calditrichota bacterium]